MRVTFVGTGAFEPEPGSDSACVLVNGRHLVDTGWNCVSKLKQYQCDPCELTTVFLSHLHADHYLGLAGLLLYIGVRRSRLESTPTPMTIVGPAEFLAETVQRTEQFLQWDVYPELRTLLNIVPVSPGGKYKNDELIVDAFPLRHTTTLSEPGRPVMSLGYSFHEKESGASFATAWDTSFNPDMAEDIRNEPVLIHDVGHTPAADVARIAKMAGVGRLFLIHYNGDGTEHLREAREVFPESFLAVEGESLEF